MAVRQRSEAVVPGSKPWSKWRISDSENPHACANLKIAIKFTVSDVYRRCPFIRVVPGSTSTRSQYRNVELGIPVRFDNSPIVITDSLIPHFHPLRKCS